MADETQLACGCRCDAAGNVVSLCEVGDRLHAASESRAQLPENREKAREELVRHWSEQD